MAGRLQGKVTIVTGGTYGIGRTAAVIFAREGAKVAISGRNLEEGQKTLNLIKKAGGEGIFIKTDIGIAAEVKAMVDRTVKEFGRLDCAFNNAGLGPVYYPLADYPEDAWDNIIRTDLKGVFLSMKYEIPEMLKAGKGSIVNNASTVGLVGFQQRAAYVAAKHGVIGVTKVGALDYATNGIRVNAVCPGYTQTPMIEAIWAKDPSARKMHEGINPMGRICAPEEVTEAALWLLSDASSFTTGLALTVDGGWVTR
jgi:NAD(P)-dependent dehydrogenase (short-subunit alcohol dehydrogenase family)